MQNFSVWVTKNWKEKNQDFEDLNHLDLDDKKLKLMEQRRWWTTRNSKFVMWWVREKWEEHNEDNNNLNILD